MPYLENLADIKFIGDLSLQDADTLAKYGKQSKNILEFGVGGSTHIFCQCSPDKLICFETDSSWIDMTTQRLDQINVDKNLYKILEYKNLSTVRDNFDLIFVDGVDNLRLDFALNTWDLLEIGGIMIFHDTRRSRDFENVANLLKKVFLEVRTIEVNVNSSNLTVITKKAREEYVNWNRVENKKAYMYGAFADKHMHMPMWSQDASN